MHRNMSRHLASARERANYSRTPEPAYICLWPFGAEEVLFGDSDHNQAVNSQMLCDPADRLCNFAGVLLIVLPPGSSEYIQNTKHLLTSASACPALHLASPVDLDVIQVICCIRSDATGQLKLGRDNKLEPLEDDENATDTDIAGASDDL